MLKRACTLLPHLSSPFSFVFKLYFGYIDQSWIYTNDYFQVLQSERPFVNIPVCILPLSLWNILSIAHHLTSSHELSCVTQTTAPKSSLSLSLIHVICSVWITLSICLWWSLKDQGGHQFHLMSVPKTAMTSTKLHVFCLPSVISVIWKDKVVLPILCWIPCSSVFSTFLMLRPFNILPHVAVTPQNNVNIVATSLL